MKKVYFEIPENCDRMDLLKVFQDNGYESGFTREIKYIPPKTFIWVRVEDRAIED